MMKRLFGMILAAFVLQALSGLVQAKNDGIYRQLNLFGDVLERIRADYVETVDDSELIQAAIAGMLRSLDPHSSYMPPKAYKNMREQMKGEFGGLGIEVTMENGIVKVVSPIDDSPASGAGMQAGDYITHLDVRPVIGLTLTEAVKLMRGPVKSIIKLTVVRTGVESPFKVKIVRDVIRIQSVRSRLEGNFIYLRITSFTEQTEKGLSSTMAKHKAELGQRFDGVILDLRNNPGGARETTTLWRFAETVHPRLVYMYGYPRVTI